MHGRFTAPKKELNKSNRVKKNKYADKSKASPVDINRKRKFSSLSEGEQKSVLYALLKERIPAIKDVKLPKELEGRNLAELVQNYLRVANPRTLEKIKQLAAKKVDPVKDKKGYDHAMGLYIAELLGKIGIIKIIKE